MEEDTHHRLLTQNHVLDVTMIKCKQVVQFLHVVNNDFCPSMCEMRVRLIGYIKKSGVPDFFHINNCLIKPLPSRFA